MNVILSIVGKLLGPGAVWFEFLKAIATTIVSTRTRPDALPGIKAMMPHKDKGFVPFLNCAGPGRHDLAVIAGDVRGGGLFDRVKDFFSNLYYLEDNDFVVDSRSMFRGEADLIPPMAQAGAAAFRSAGRSEGSLTPSLPGKPRCRISTTPIKIVANCYKGWHGVCKIPMKGRSKT